MSKKILVVDDEADIVILVKSRLESEGYKVLEAHNGEDAITIAQANKPDLIILDIMMPDMDGIEVSNILKEDANLKDIPIIFLTALKKKSDEGNSLSDKGNIVLGKPFEADSLLKSIRQLI
ncbi:MAG: CheY-like chemotaxis protein [Candidatus Omnitrophota bacterium]|jgi:CheY-like chemotaxis protein